MRNSQNQNRGSTTPSSASGASRTQSPRTTSVNVVDTGAAVRKRSAVQSSRNSAHRSSTNLNLQEDLLKLISPEYEDSVPHRALPDQKSRVSEVLKLILDQ